MFNIQAMEVEKWSDFNESKVSVVLNYPRQKFLCQQNFVHKCNKIIKSKSKVLDSAQNVTKDKNHLHLK